MNDILHDIVDELDNCIPRHIGRNYGAAYGVFSQVTVIYRSTGCCYATVYCDRIVIHNANNRITETGQFWLADPNVFEKVSELVMRITGGFQHVKC